MSTNNSRCHFPNCDCKFFILLKFQDKHLYKGGSHDIDRHTASVNFSPNVSFPTTPSAPTPQYCHVTTDSKHAPNFQGPPTPHHNNFLPIMPRENTETVARSATSNLQLMKLSQ